MTYISNKFTTHTITCACLQPWHRRGMKSSTRTEILHSASRRHVSKYPLVVGKTRRTPVR